MKSSTKEVKAMEYSYIGPDGKKVIVDEEEYLRMQAQQNQRKSTQEASVKNFFYIGPNGKKV